MAAGKWIQDRGLEVQLSCTVGQVAECPKALKAGGEKRLKSIVSSTQQIRGCKGRLCPPGERNTFPNLQGSLHVLTSLGAVRLQASQGSCLSLIPTKVAQLEVKRGSLLSHSVLTVLPLVGTHLSQCVSLGRNICRAGTWANSFTRSVPFMPGQQAPSCHHTGVRLGTSCFLIRLTSLRHPLATSSLCVYINN